MENRRAHYRHLFHKSVCLPVRLVSPVGEISHGTIVDMSIGGISVRLLEPEPPPEPLTHERWFVAFALAAEQREVLLPARVIHYQPTEPALVGYRFLPLIDPRANEDVQKRIWAYLLAEQCRARRQSD